MLSLAFYMGYPHKALKESILLFIKLNFYYVRIINWNAKTLNARFIKKNRSTTNYDLY